MSSPSSSEPAPLTALLENARHHLVFSAYQYWVEKKGLVHAGAGGITSYWIGGKAVGDTTYFDIGSVTKPVVATTLAALAVDKNLLGLSQTLGEWIPAWKGQEIGNRTVRDVLCHAAGFTAWKLLEPGKRSASEFILAEAPRWLEAQAGTRTAYSDLGFLVLGEVLQSVWKKPLETAWKENVVKALALEEVAYGPLPATVDVVATEVRGVAPLQGVVFDENSAALGGRTPHAGLFATAAGLAPWARAWLEATQQGSGWLSQKTATLFTTRADRVAGSSWALGWDTKSPSGSSAGKLFGARSFGHLGYPGCSVWVDPEAGGFAVLHTNRVHPSRLDERIRQLRPEFHDAVFRVWEQEA